MSFKDKIDKIFHKKKSDEELINEELPEDDAGEINFEDTSPEEEAKTLQKKKIMLAGGVVLVVAIAAVVSNAMTDKKVQQERPLSSASMVASPAQALPDKYSDISKYQKQNEQDEMKQRKDEIRGKSDTRNVKTNNTAQRQQQQTQSSSGGGERVVYVDRPSSSSGSSAIDRQAEKERDEAEERRQAMISSSLAFNIASDIAGGKSVKQAIDDNISASDTSSSYVASSGSYTLNAGTIIPATLLTGITSDVPNGDVVAQIRQDVYDSLYKDNTSRWKFNHLARTKGD